MNHQLAPSNGIAGSRADLALPRRRAVAAFGQGHRELHGPAAAAAGGWAVSGFGWIGGVPRFGVFVFRFLLFLSSCFFFGEMHGWVALRVGGGLPLDEHESSFPFVAAVFFSQGESNYHWKYVYFCQGTEAK